MTEPKERPCLMVVDDDSTIRAMLQAALEASYAVVCLANGEEVIQSIETRAPRVILLDINIPGSSGHDICQRVREQAKLRKLPILFMTIRKDNAAFLESLESGGDALICKPFEIPALREKIDHLLSRHPAD